MANVVMGNSGFMYTISNHKGSKYRGDSKTCIIKNVATGKILFSLTGKEGDWRGRGLSATKSRDSVGTNKFLGLDNRYYYIHVTYHKADWGQIQSSGAVLRENRTVLTTLNFFPMNIETPTVPVIKTAPITPIVPNVPVVTITPEAPVEINEPTIPQVREIVWVEKTIKAITRQITLLIQMITNLFQKRKT